MVFIRYVARKNALAYLFTLVVLNKHTMEYVCVNMGDSQGIHLKDNTYY